MSTTPALWPTPAGAADRTVLGGGQPEGCVRLGQLGRGGRPRDRVGGHPGTTAATTEAKKRRPSADGPVSGSTACSGCGIRPTTLPSALHTPAMAAADPLGLPSAYLS